MAVLHMVLELRGEVDVLFNDTRVEYPETYAFRDRISREWPINLVEATPRRSFWWVVENYGFPLFARGGRTDASKQCCRYLKEYPVQKAVRSHKWDLYITGLTAAESVRRRWSANKYGPYFFARELRLWKCHPILEWSAENVWAYHRRFGLPHNALYDRPAPEGFEVRTGCWTCTIPIRYGKIEFLRNNYPRLWRTLLGRGLAAEMARRKLGLDEGAPAEQVALLVEKRPCFFDRLP